MAAALHEAMLNVTYCARVLTPEVLRSTLLLEVFYGLCSPKCHDATFQTHTVPLPSVVLGVLATPCHYVIKMARIPAC